MYQRIVVVGHLGRDPQMRFTSIGKAVTNFSVATSRRWTGQDDQQRDETIWFRVSVWGRQAESCNQYLKKGRQVLIEGRLRPDENGNPRIWTGQDGQPRAQFEIVARDVRFLDGKGSSPDPEDDPGILLEEEEEFPF